MENLPPVYDQGLFGDCIANAVAYVNLIKTGGEMSRLFVYALSRILENTPLNQDIGATISSAGVVLRKYGFCPESIFPHSVTPKAIPTLECFQSCQPLPSFAYRKVPRNLETMKTILSSGTPIVFGINAYESLISPRVNKTGMVTMPNVSKERLLGGHCICMVGFNDANSTFMCANSWGSGWGYNGFLFLPYNYILNSKLSMDFTVFEF
jgi:C1A family cysteine protease